MVKMAADAIRYGLDPEKLIDQGKEDFLLNLAILKRLAKVTVEERYNEMEALSKLIAGELAQILVKMF